MRPTGIHRGLDHEAKHVGCFARRKCGSGIVLAPPVAPSPQGHQVTPQVTEYVIARHGFSEGIASGAGTWTGFSAPCVARVGSSFNLAFDAKTSVFDGVFVKHAATTALFPSLEILRTTQDTITVVGIGTDLDITMAGQPAQPQAIGYVLKFDIDVSDPVFRFALVVATVE